MSIAPEPQGQQPAWQQPPAAPSAGYPPPGSAGTGQPGRPLSPGKQILLTIVTLGIWSYVWTYRQHEEIKQFSGEGIGGGLGVVLALVTGELATVFILASEIEKNLYGRTGQPSPVSAATGAFVLIPFVGSFIWYFKVQRALNEFWVSQGAQPA